MTLLSKMPRGPGILLLGSQHVPGSRVGHLSWGAAYLGGSIMSEQIAELRAAGAEDIFVWAHPNRWNAGRFEESVADAERVCAQYGLAGYIADPEVDVTDTQAAYFGSLLKRSAERGLSVGVTSFSGFNDLAGYARGAEGACWGLCQIYNRGSDDAQDFAAWLGTFILLFGRAIPCVATFVPDTDTGSQLSTPAGYDTYLSKIPDSSGYGSFGSGPSFMQLRLQRWRPENPIDTALWAIGIPTIAHIPTVYSVMLLVLIALGITMFYFFRRR